MSLFSPSKFVLFFTLSMTSYLVGLAFMNGPQTYLKKMTTRKYRIISGVLAFSIVMSLYCTLLSSHTLLAMLFCFVEFNCVLMIYCNSSPIGLSKAKEIGNGIKTMVQLQMNR
jgi:hypothetical protein